MSAIDSHVVLGMHCQSVSSFLGVKE